MEPAPRRPRARSPGGRLWRKAACGKWHLVEAAWHRRDRQRRSADRTLARIAAACVRLADHHGSEVPRAIWPLVQLMRNPRAAAAPAEAASTVAEDKAAAPMGMSATSDGCEVAAVDAEVRIPVVPGTVGPVVGIVGCGAEAFGPSSSAPATSSGGGLFQRFVWQCPYWRLVQCSLLLCFMWYCTARFQLVWQFHWLRDRRHLRKRVQRRW